MTSKRKAEQPPVKEEGLLTLPSHSTSRAGRISRLPLTHPSPTPLFPPVDAKADVAGTGAHGSAVVFPGDVLSLRGSVVRLGSGLLQSGSNVVASRAGRIQHGANARLSVDNVQKRVRAHTHPPLQPVTLYPHPSLLPPPSPQYLPAAEDLVIGLVCEKHSESYKVDIGGPELATLPALAFEGATKRNKPNIPVSPHPPHLLLHSPPPAPPPSTRPTPPHPSHLFLPPPPRASPTATRFPPHSSTPSSTAACSAPTATWRRS